MRSAILTAYTGSRNFGAFDTATGAFSVQIGPNEARAFRLRIEALVARGQVRLAAKPLLSSLQAKPGLSSWGRRALFRSCSKAAV
jgi:hypothetical protein